MSIYFNIIIPINTFLEIAKEVMQKHNIKLYIEKASIKGNIKRRYYADKLISEKDFIEEEYRCFFFSVADIDLRDKEIIIESGKVIHSDWFSFYDKASLSIEGTGGRENSNNIEQIHLRQIYKEPDKEIKAFYNALQSKLKRIEGIKLFKQKGLSIYYMDTEKRIWSYFEKQIPSAIENLK